MAFVQLSSPAVLAKFLGPGLTTVTLAGISKAGGAFAAPSDGAVLSLGNGWYSVSLDATDLNTLGDLALDFAAVVGAPVEPAPDQVVPNIPGGAVTQVNGDVLGSVGGNVSGSVQGNLIGNVGGNVTGSVGSVAGNVAGSVASVVGAVGSVTGNVGGNVTGSVGSVVGAVGSVTGNVGGNLTGDVGGHLVGDVQGKVLGGGVSTFVADGVQVAGGGGDPWATALPGSYGAGTAGKIIGDRVDAAVSSRSTFAGGAVASVTGAVGSVTGDVGGNLIGKVLGTGSTAFAGIGVQISGGVDPWATPLPGTYGTGTAGNILGSRLDATVSSRGTFSGGNVAGVTGNVSGKVLGGGTGTFLGVGVQVGEGKVIDTAEVQAAIEDLAKGFQAGLTLDQALTRTVYQFLESLM